MDMDVTYGKPSVTIGVDTMNSNTKLLTLSMKDLGKGLCKDLDKSIPPPNEMSVEV